MINSEFNEIDSKVVGVGYGADEIANDLKSMKHEAKRKENSWRKCNR
jgi:hypothetical protein